MPMEMASVHSDTSRVSTAVTREGSIEAVSVPAAAEGDDALGIAPELVAEILALHDKRSRSHARLRSVSQTVNTLCDALQALSLRFDGLRQKLHAKAGSISSSEAHAQVRPLDEPAGVVEVPVQAAEAAAEPKVFAVVSTYHCLQCGEACSIYKCSRCNVATYCNERCQVADWKAAHRRICDDMRTVAAALGAVGPGAVSRDLMSVARRLEAPHATRYVEWIDRIYGPPDAPTTDYSRETAISNSSVPLQAPDGFGSPLASSSEAVGDEQPAEPTPQASGALTAETTPSTVNPAAATLAAP
jgi:hypothetical protein